MTLSLSTHPLVQSQITILRDRETSASDFRRASDLLTQILLIEAAKTLEVVETSVDSPLETTCGYSIRNKIVLVPILRAGLGMLNTATQIFPDASVGFIGLERDEVTSMASCYYNKMPPINEDSHVFVLDPMLATGGSAVQTIDRLKEIGAKRITMVSIISAPEGVANFCEKHPEVGLITGVVDQHLDAKKYIRPGLGDFGDRLFAS